MGRFVNPDNSAFQKAVNSEIYVDKTGFLSYTNKVIDTKQAFICNSRPRRFGKSTTADMLAAYYSKGCDSENLFADLAVSDTEDFHKYLNNAEWCCGIFCPGWCCSAASETCRTEWDFLCGDCRMDGSDGASCRQLLY